MQSSPEASQKEALSRLLLHLPCALVLLILSLAGCAIERGPVFVKDGQTYGVTSGLTWRGRWWNYYERGNSYASGAFWSEAIADLQAALAQQHTDERDARTYGLHFVDYFPHRELGIVYYRLGRYMDAIHELETSLRNVDTARAKFYLNRARREQLRHDGRTLALPRLVLDGPADGLRTNRRTLTVMGRAESSAHIAAAAVQGQALFVELAEPRLPLAQEVALGEGRNAIEVTAEDLLGRVARAQVTVYVDRRGPLVSLERVAVIESAGARRVRVEGVLSDDSPVQRFTLAGRSVAVRPEDAWEFHEDVPLAADTTALPFEAEDAAGNVTRGEVALPPAAASPPGIREGKRLQPPPRTPSPPAPLPWSRWAALAPGTVLADLPTAPAGPPPSLPPPERTPPVIVTTLAETQTVYDDEILLGGAIRAAEAIVAFSINGASQLPGNAKGRPRTRQLFFGMLVPLQVGENRFLLEAQDATGLASQRQVVVTRQVPEVLQLASRLHIVVPPLGREGETSLLGATAYDHLLAAFVQQKRFRLLERQRLEDILREHALSRTGLVDPAMAIRLGKLAAAEGTVLGTVTQKTPQALEVTTRFIDVETGEQMATADVYGEDLTLPDIKALMQGLAWKLQQYFPLVEGRVLDRQGSLLTVDRGSRHAPLQQHMKVLLFRDPVRARPRSTGGALGQETAALGEARVKEVAAVMSKVTLLPAARASDVQTLDRFITK